METTAGPEADAPPVRETVRISVDLDLADYFALRDEQGRRFKERRPATLRAIVVEALRRHVPARAG